MIEREVLTRALGAARTYRDVALEALRARLAARHIDSEQHAAHGFAWVATSVVALEAMLGWLERNGNANPLDAQIAQIAFAETLAQLIGGLPMGQNELFRPMDLGLGDAFRALGAASGEVLYRDHAAARTKDSGRRCDIEAGMAKLLSTRAAWSNADAALQVHGGNGYALKFEISRVLCDARILNIFEGAAEIQAQVIARGLLEGRN